MKTSKRVIAASAAALLATLALGGGVANAADGGGKASPRTTVHVAPGTEHVAAKKLRPASEDNGYSQTVKAKPGTPHTSAGVLADQGK